MAAVYYIGSMFKTLRKLLKGFLAPVPFEPNVQGATFAYSNPQYHIRVTPDRILYHSLDGPFFNDIYQHAWFVYGEHLDEDWFRSRGINLLDKAPWFRNSMDRMIFLDNVRKLRQANIGKVFRDTQGFYYSLDADGKLKPISMTSRGGGGGGGVAYFDQSQNSTILVNSGYGGGGGHGDSYTITT